MISRVRAVVVLLLAMVPLGWRDAAAQEVALASRGPRFLAAATPTSAPTPLDVRQVAVLRKQIAVNLDGVTLKHALLEITRQTGLAFAYTYDIIDPETRVQLKAEKITVAAAVTEILLDAGVDVLLSSPRQAALVKRIEAGVVQTGSVVGRVIDAKTQTALAGATVVVQGTSRSTTTGSDGRYRIAEVAPGTYTVRARYIGYAPGVVSATVSSGQEATADFTLEKSAQRLDEVVTTGTVVPTEVKALPTPVTVIGDSLIALQRPHTINELFRQAVPTAVSWDFPRDPEQTTFSARGATSLGGTGSGMKVLIDGIPAVGSDNAAVDPTSIERIEVIRGPQAAAIYGSDAIGGVVQIFTKRGDPTITRPQVNAEAALGLVQAPYVGYGGVLRQDYKASVRGGAPAVSYHLGAGYSHTADNLPNGEASALSSASVYGGIHFERGMITADVSGRYYGNTTAYNAPPEFFQTGDPYYSKPFYEPRRYQNQSVMAQFSVAPTTWWQNTVTAGIDRLILDDAQTQPRLTTPDDTLLEVFDLSQTKTSIGYNTSIHSTLGAGISGSLTAGIDHYNNPSGYWYSYGARATTGTIRTGPGGFIGAYRTITNNTGYFAQAQLGIRDALFLTGGLRAEQNTNFGDSLGTPISPRVGLTYVHPVGGATLKLRGSWGRAIRPPSPGEKAGAVSAAYVTLASPELGPERQHGWDAGIDAVFGTRGSLNLTYYDQTADNLIQYVQLQATPILTYQFQNVARVKNSGVEVEGTVSVGVLQLRGQYGYTRARVEQLAPNYTGDLLPGDQVLSIPRHTAGASLALTPLPHTTLAGGLTYVGSWDQYDNLAAERCFGGTGPCQPTSRDYIVAYPSMVKLNATLSQQINPLVSGFISVDNLTNNQASEYTNGIAGIGRTTTVGIQFHH